MAKALSIATLEPMRTESANVFSPGPGGLSEETRIVGEEAPWEASRMKRAAMKKTTWKKEVRGI